MLRSTYESGCGARRVVDNEGVYSAIDRLNRRAMASAGAVRQYAQAHVLEPSEEAALAYVADEVRDRPILDLGIGGGRTVAPLRALSRDYVGIDYAPAMIEASRRAHPDADLRVADARCLNELPSAHFQLAFFSCNGLGMVDQVGRLRALAAVRRVLVPGGVFAFSTHNRAAPAARFTLPPLEPTRHPLRLAVRTARFARDAALGAVNRARFLRHEYATDDYEIVNAASHAYGVMLYKITLEAQRRQLAAAGFELDAAFDLAGARVERTDTTDDSILYVARRRG